jgi:type IV secretory pathway VirD2 relaxase
MALRSIVKHSYIKSFGDGKARAKAHVNYIKFRPGKDKDEEKSRSFFSDKEDGLTSHPVHEAIQRQTGRGVLVHKLIISPGVQDANAQEYVREVMHDLGQQKGLELEWYAVEHRNTANPHCHVVVMGKDKNGRLVKLSRDDYTKLKEAGDKYLERNKLLDKEKLREKGKELKSKPFGNKLKEALKAAKSEFDRVMKSDAENEKERKLTRFEVLRAQEAESLGDAPNYDQLAAKKLAKEEKAQAAKQEAWKHYSKSIEVEIAGESVKYSWNMPISQLRELERRHQAAPVLSERDQEKLQTWIKDAYFEEQYLARQVQELEQIAVNRGESVDKLTKDSTLDKLQEAEKLHKSGAVILSAAEEKALSNWLEHRLEQEPIKVAIAGVDQPVVYDKQDSKESLKFLADEYRKGEDWARDGITKAEYKKLRTWIKEKREPEKTQEPEKQRDLKEERQ